MTTNDSEFTLGDLSRQEYEFTLHDGFISDADRARIVELAVELTCNIPYCPIKPNPGPQTMFLLDFSKEALYGGAAGGGKSYAVMMAASQFLDIPGYSALLLRKSFQQLTKPGALMDIADDWWGGKKGCHYNAQEKKWYFDCPGGGQSSITFGYMDKENDRFNYQGGAYHFVAYDELTQFKERDYRYLFSRMRKIVEGPLSQVPIRMRSTANPGGIGHQWVFDRFIRPWTQWKKGTRERPGRNFHPAIIDDNPKLDRVDYEESLQELDPVTRAQLLRGDWNIRPEGRMFKRDWFKRISLDQIPGNCQWVRFWDMAATEEKPDTEPDFTVGAKIGRSRDGNYYIMDLRRWRKEPADQDAMIKSIVNMDTRRVIQCMEQEPGASGKIAIHHYRTGSMEGSNFRSIPATGSKVLRAAPVASHADAGHIYLVDTGTWNIEEFLEEIEIFPDGLHDDQVDAVSGAFSVLAKLHVGALNFGQPNKTFLSNNPWRPDVTPNLSASELVQMAIREGFKEGHHELTHEYMQRVANDAFMV